MALPAILCLRPAVLQFCYYSWVGLPIGVSKFEKLWELPIIGVGYAEGLVLAAVSSADGATLGYIVSLIYRMAPG